MRLTCNKILILNYYNAYNCKSYIYEFSDLDNAMILGMNLIKLVQNTGGFHTYHTLPSLPFQANLSYTKMSFTIFP